MEFDKLRERREAERAGASENIELWLGWTSNAKVNSFESLIRWRIVMVRGKEMITKSTAKPHWRLCEFFRALVRRGFIVQL